MIEITQPNTFEELEIITKILEANLFIGTCRFEGLEKIYNRFKEYVPREIAINDIYDRIGLADYLLEVCPFPSTWLIDKLFNVRHYLFWSKYKVDKLEVSDLINLELERLELKEHVNRIALYSNTDQRKTVFEIEHYQVFTSLKNEKSPYKWRKNIIDGATDRIRTCDLRIRSPLLYPAELRLQLKTPSKVLTFNFQWFGDRDSNSG
jgi:hypothetical protein